MNTKCFINVDLADAWADPGRKNFLRAVAWGDEVTVIDQTSTRIEIETVSFTQKKDGSVLPVKKTAYIEPTKSSGIKPSDIVRPSNQNEVLKVNFVDVQQGDGAVIESPDGKVILVDGGDNQMFARYLAGRFRDTTPDNPKQIDCILVTHGDADHFAGLPEILKSEKNKEERKRFFMQPLRYYQNGLVKRPDKINGKAVAETAMFGPAKIVGSDLLITDLVDNLLDVPDTEMNKPFRNWKATLAEYNKRKAMEFRRLEFDDTTAFQFFNNSARNMKIEVFGPLVTEEGGVRGLKFLGNPPTGPRVGHESLDLETKPFTGYSASHTINGHSIVFRLSYGRFSYLFCGDLNDEASRFLVNEQNGGRLKLKSEVYKVPHHGSADFSGAFIQAVSPVVSVVSSGDENTRKEYIHPRATLMGALGKYSRVPEPLIFVTELVAFFNVEGWSKLSHPRTDKEKKRGDFFGFSRTCYGIVKTRTNGKRLFVYTDSGNVKIKEAYAYEFDPSGIPQPAPVKRA